ncbi:acetylornithine deacetylase [Kordiimonas sediminis]|uniref:Acetylornithine deacetylase n=1 Tax=Kordiimonas sediminis TaxID=1735581 RepID=A0A919APE9_9PROT|nr:hydrolase [Kordiimonas sediminis]GHF18681.1 acetylornithine deacetylase [Kordiimonas sediminis]
MSNDLMNLLVTDEVKTTLDWLDAQQVSMQETVINWSHINSGSRNLDGLSAMEDEIVSAFRCLDTEIELIQLEDTETVLDSGEVTQVANGRTIRIFKRPTANRRVLMTGHYDTVFPKNSAFQKTHWLDENTLNGPGVADMKGGILVMLHALQGFEKTAAAANVGWEVLLSPDEETGSLASAPLLADRAQAAHIGMTYEPALADGTLAGERKGSGNYTVRVQGKAAHAGREFFEGRNAVVLLAGIIGKLSALTGGREGLTVNPAVITGGVAPNIVPDLAMCRFNVRLKAPEDAPWFEGEVQKIIDTANTEDGFTVELFGGINRPPKALSDANLKLMDLIGACGKSLGLSIAYVPTGGCCEGNNLAAAGLPNVDTLGVRGGMIHSDEEFMIVESLSERAKLSFLILTAFAHGALDSVISAR